MQKEQETGGASRIEVEVERGTKDEGRAADGGELGRKRTKKRQFGHFVVTINTIHLCEHFSFFKEAKCRFLKVGGESEKASIDIEVFSNLALLYSCLNSPSGVVRLS